MANNIGYYESRKVINMVTKLDEIQLSDMKVFYDAGFLNTSGKDFYIDLLNRK